MVGKHQIKLCERIKCLVLFAKTDFQNIKVCLLKMVATNCTGNVTKLEM